MHRKKVSHSSSSVTFCILMAASFAWMEILKAVAVVFKLFHVKRINPAPTVIREGFFNKAVECEVEIHKRRFN